MKSKNEYYNFFIHSLNPQIFHLSLYSNLFPSPLGKTPSNAPRSLPCPLFSFQSDSNEDTNTRRRHETTCFFLQKLAIFFRSVAPRFIRSLLKTIYPASPFSSVRPSVRSSVRASTSHFSFSTIP